MLRRQENHAQITDRKEGSQTSAKPTLHPEFTMVSQVLSRGSATESLGEHIQGELNNPTIKRTDSSIGLESSGKEACHLDKWGKEA